MNAILWLRKGHEYLGDFWWKSWSFNVFWIHFPTFYCVNVLFFKYIWQNLGFGVYRNLRFKLKSFEMLSYGQSLLNVILNCVSFLQREFVPLPFQKCLVSLKKSGKYGSQFHVLCLCVSGGGGCAPGNTTEKPRDFVEVHSCVELWWRWSCGRIDWWSMVLGSCLGRCLSSKGGFFHGWNIGRGCKGVLLEKPTCSRFFCLFCFGTFLLAKIKVCFVCMAYIMSILCGLIMFD